MNTITMYGDSTGYGASAGAEDFVLNGYGNTVLLAGAAETVGIAGGGLDLIDLNATGFAGAVSETLDLGTSNFDTILASHALQSATVAVTGGSGMNTLSLVNHGGSTSISLGNTGNAVNRWGAHANDRVTLNGDAANQVSFGAGAGAEVTIGAAGDGFTAFASAVTLNGVYDLVTGGDEQFSIQGSGGLTQVSLGNGADTVALAGDGNIIFAGDGADTVTLTGAFDQVRVGTGNDVVSDSGGGLHLKIASGGAGASDSIALANGGNLIIGGDENTAISGAAAGAQIRLGNGSNTVTIGHGSVFTGTSLSNTATNRISIAAGGAIVTATGGVNTITLGDAKGGHDLVRLNGTMLGTSVTMNGALDHVLLTADANASITDNATNGAAVLSIQGDAHGGIGDIAVSGFAHDSLAQINLSGTSGYTVTVDDTASGGLTLHFTGGGSIDLIGVQAIPDHLIQVG